MFYGCLNLKNSLLYVFFKKRFCFSISICMKCVKKIEKNNVKRIKNILLKNYAQCEYTLHLNSWNISLIFLFIFFNTTNERINLIYLSKLNIVKKSNNDQAPYIFSSIILTLDSCWTFHTQFSNGRYYGQNSWSWHAAVGYVSYNSNFQNSFTFFKRIYHWHIE